MSLLSLRHSNTQSTIPSILPLEKSKSSPTTPCSPLIASLGTPVSRRHTSHLIIVCCLITGLLDSTLFYGFGTFVSGQTGNTILFGLGASTAHVTERPYRWAKSLVAIISFALGCAAFSHATRALGKLKRGTLILSFVFQAFVVLLVAIILQTEVVEGILHKVTKEIDWRDCLPIALLSFQSAGQIVASRALGHDGIPTVVLTSMFHDIATDPDLLAWNNVKRNRRLGAFAATLLGALAGGFISISSGRMQSTLWVVGGLKLGIAGAWVVWPAEEIDEIV